MSKLERDFPYLRLDVVPFAEYIAIVLENTFVSVVETDRSMGAYRFQLTVLISNPLVNSVYEFMPKVARSVEELLRGAFERVRLEHDFILP
jgi:hypothetical protein